MGSYVRTEAGTAAVTNPRVFLPTRLRALLAALDGRVDPFSQGAGSMRPEEVRLMLETLCKVGYVREVGDAGSAAANDSRPASLTANGAPVQAMTPIRTTSPATPPMASSGGADPREAIARMSDFVMTHLPSEALNILFTLEGLSTATQLRAALGAYTQHIAHLGAPARQHLAEIEALLSAAPTSIPTPT